MKRITILLSVILTWNIMPAQDYNLSLVGQLDYELNTSDVWAYVSPSGTEYAIMGIQNGTAIISLADPSNPTEVAFVPGGNSIWRDMKTYGHYAYITTEATDGILVIDLADIDNGNVSHNFHTPSYNAPPLVGQLLSIHNLYIDEDGYCYIAGANLNNGGILIYDLNANPTQPPLAGACEGIYSHDVYVRNDTLYSSNVNDGHFSIIDVSDKANPFTLAYQETSFDFSHNAWLSDDGRYLFTTDELPNANIDAYDVSNLNNIQRLDTWVPPSTAGLGVIPHNVHVQDDFLVISYYTDGVKIVDAQRPHNMVEVGSYDTHTENTNGFYGCWGAYPFLPSGLLLASDIERGLFVLQPNYQRACYLEGLVTAADTGIPLNGVGISLDSGLSGITPSNGMYAIGQIQAGTFQATYSKLGYIPQTISVTLENGQLTTQDVSLVPGVPITVSGEVVDEATGTPIPNAFVSLQGEQGNHSTTTNTLGQYQVEDIFQGDYQVYAGLWGYETTQLDITLDENTTTIPSQALRKGYQDPFALDLGWTKEGTASSGQWELGKPIGTYYEGNTLNPDADVEGDIGEACYVTGNAGGGAGDDDVDGGFVRLISPVFDISGYEEAYVYFRRWFMNVGGNGNPDDELRIYLRNGTDEALLLQDGSNTNGWAMPEEYRISEFITPTATMQLVVETSDLPISGHLVEAGFDDFRVTDGKTFPILTGQVSEEDNGTPIPAAPVRIRGAYRDYLATTGGDGHYTIPDVIPGDYSLYTGKWGYNTIRQEVAVNSGENQVSDASLKIGYEDPFVLDLGWEVSGDAVSGIWERAEPIGTELDGVTYNPPHDADWDHGTECYVTGNGGGDAGADDVDDGTTILTSPAFDLSDYHQAIIKYRVWFMNGGGNGTPNDSMTIHLSNGTEEVLLETISHSTVTWTGSTEINVSDYLSPSSNMRLIVSVSDQADSSHIVEAGFDQFFVVEGQPLADEEVITNVHIQISPNPFGAFFALDVPEVLLGGDAWVFDALGRMMGRRHNIQVGQMQWEASHWPAGVYYLVYAKDGKTQHLRLVKR